MDKKLIFLDIDGTLTEPGCNVPPASAIEAVKKARTKGHYVFACTGRNYDMLSPVLQYGFDGFVASSGGYIQCGEQVIYDCPMAEEQKEQVLLTLHDKNSFCTVECRDGSFRDNGFREFLLNCGNGECNSEMLRWRAQIEESLHILPIDAYSGQPVYKIVAMNRTKENLEQAKELLGGDYNFCIQDTDNFGYANGEVMPAAFHKGTGIQRVCEYLGMPLSATMAFGDSMNDREMIETAAVGICMANGSDGIKRIADDICPAVIENGLEAAFAKYGLI